MASTQAIIFDLDDTLYAERTYVFSGYRAVAKAFAARLASLADPVARMEALFASPQRARVFDVLVAEAGVPEAERAALIAEMIAAYRSHTPAIVLLPEAAALLARLSAKVRLGVISDGYLPAQQAKATALGLAERVDEIILTDAWGRAYWKPHPQAFEEMADRLGVAHAACAYVSDNLAKDFVAPNALGWRTVLVDRPDRVYAEAVAPDGGVPDYVVRSLAEVPGVLGIALAAGRG